MNGIITIAQHGFSLLHGRINVVRVCIRGIYHALLKKGKDWVAYFPLLEIRKDFITLIIIVLVHVIHIIIFPLVHPSVPDEHVGHFLQIVVSFTLSCL